MLLVLIEAVLGLLSQTPFHECNPCQKPPSFYVIFPESTIKNPPASKVKSPPPLAVSESLHQRTVCLVRNYNNNFTTTPNGVFTSVTSATSSPATTVHRIDSTLLSTSLSTNNISTDGTPRKKGNRNELACLVLLLVIPVFIFVLVYKRDKIFPSLDRKKEANSACNIFQC
ncbi:uncharacterized protein [Amphiura filiformis]|uniref:uncharacterized protein n=1 Tax=Amphiura filiformis TaxID=82378 RepID=UPI003B21ABC8